MDPALIAIVGTASGAAATGLVDVAKVIVQGRQQRKVEEAKRKHDAEQAQAQRDADAAEREAQRKHDAAQAQAQRDAAQRAERAEQVRQLREGLDAAHREYAEWYAKQRATPPKPPSAKFAPEPNIVSAPWFQDLRPRLQDTGSPKYLRTGDSIQCDDDTAEVLGDEIGRIAEEWLGD